MATRTFPLTGFIGVAAEAFTVTVSAGPFAVSVTADDNIFDRLLVAVDGQRLLLGLVPGTSLRGVTLTAQVSLPDLTALDASGSARITVGGFNGSTSRAVSASGASVVNGNFDSGPVRVELSGASTGHFSGRCTDLDVRAGGASHLEALGLNCSTATVDLSGASDGTITAQSVQGQLSGASRLLYGPETASVRVDTSGASSVARR
ncbi:MAG: hypothetical protein QOJ19_3523 [Acidimicrobiia bacterium]|jgi:hypothetical protein|nr:hypothetical protein [Acidimicrobiia bacterium]